MNSNKGFPTDLWVEEKTLFKKGFKRLAGIDEAGRGPLAGPVVAAAVSSMGPIDDLDGINDSKRLTHQERARLFPLIMNHPALLVGVGVVSPLEIDQINILQASLLAFSKALKEIKIQPDCCLIDGKQTSPWISVHQEAFVKGDQRSFLIGAASIIAKETRDKIMEEYHHQYPPYNFLKHKGYPTKAHIEAIQKHGICPIHRKTFKPIQSLILSAS